VCVCVCVCVCLIVSSRNLKKLVTEAQAGLSRHKKSTKYTTQSRWSGIHKIIHPVVTRGLKLRAKPEYLIENYRRLGCDVVGSGILYT